MSILSHSQAGQKQGAGADRSVQAGRSFRDYLFTRESTAMPNQGIVRFGAELQKRRKEHRIKGVDFAESIGISQGELSRWERGVSRGGEGLAELPDGRFLRAISESLGWPLNEMMRIVNRGRDMQERDLQDPNPQGRDPLVASADEAAELRDHGILYAAGYSELSSEMKLSVLAVIEALHKQDRERRGE